MLARAAERLLSNSATPLAAAAFAGSGGARRAFAAALAAALPVAERPSSSEARTQQHLQPPPPRQQQQQQQQSQQPQWLGHQRNAGLQEFVPQFKGLLVDAAGTLLSPSEPAAEVYLRIARKYGCELTAQQVLQRFRHAYNTPWGQSTIRYVGDGRPFWRHIVQESTGCCSDEMFEELYEYYARGDSYFVTPGAEESIRRIRAAGLKTAVVSNFDTRLWRILRELDVDSLFDAVIISAEVHAEKPNPVIFNAACAALGLPPEQCVHVGDDRRNDLYGARDAGIYAWLWGADVFSFAQVERRLATGNFWDSIEGAP